MVYQYSVLSTSQTATGREVRCRIDGINGAQAKQIIDLVKQAGAKCLKLTYSYSPLNDRTDARITIRGSSQWINTLTREVDKI